MTDRSDPALEAALVDLAAAIRFPPTPSLAAQVAAQVAAQIRATPDAMDRRGWALAWPAGGRPLRRAAVLAVAAVALLAGVAGAIGIGIGAIQIRFADGSPLPTPLASVLDRGLGEETSLSEAQAAVPFDIRLPADPLLGPPDAVFLAGVPQGGTVTLAWGNRPDFPADDQGFGLLVTEFRADIGPDTFEKLILEGTRVESVTVNERPGWWIEGGTHAFFYRDLNGEYVDTTLRLVTSALIWDENGLALRVEGAPDLQAALQVAAALR